MVPKTPSCYCMLLMNPSRLKFLRSLFHIYNNHCHRATAYLQLNKFIIIIIIIIIITKGLDRWLATGKTRKHLGLYYTGPLCAARV
jgi:hypothetical protein